MNVAHEVELLVQEIKRLGTQNADGNYETTFGVLFHDTRCANIFEGTYKNLVYKDLNLICKSLFLRNTMFLNMKLRL